MLLRVKANDEGWNIDDLLPNPVHWIRSRAISAAKLELTGCDAV